MLIDILYSSGNEWIQILENERRQLSNKQINMNQKKCKENKQAKTPTKTRSNE